MMSTQTITACGVGVAAAAGGYALAAHLVDSVRHNDIVSEPRRDVGRDGGFVLSQENTPMADKLAGWSLGAVALAGGLGALLLTSTSTNRIPHEALLRAVGGAAALGGALGFGTGAISRSVQTSGTIVRDGHVVEPNAIPLG